MKFHPDAMSANAISAYGPGWVKVGAERLTSSFIITSRGQRLTWDCNSFTSLQSRHFEQLAELNTELVIFGSGERIRFPSAALTCSLIQRQIGLETMDNQAACRTYNVLAAEGREVALALLMDTSA
jgi:uncharacterized protein